MTLTPAQQDAVQHARDFYSAYEGGKRPLAEFVHTDPEASGVYAVATGYAARLIEDLTGIIDSLTAASRVLAAAQSDCFRDLLADAIAHQRERGPADREAAEAQIEAYRGLAQDLGEV